MATKKKTNLYIGKGKGKIMEMMLKTNELCKTFKDQKAVNKVSLNIPRVVYMASLDQTEQESRQH